MAADDAENVTVEGAGALHGQAPEELLRGAKQRPDFRTRLVLFTNCRNVQVRNIRMLYSDSWTLHLKRCSDVVIDGITIFNNIDRINSDGIDPDSCRNVRISNCHIVAGDDCIVLKCTTAHPCENVVVTNCTLESGATAIKLGTESHAAFRDVHYSNCTIDRSSGGIGLFVKDGACMERLTFSNISITDRENESVASGAAPIFMDIERRHADSPLGHIRDVVLNGIQIHSRFPSFDPGDPGVAYRKPDHPRSVAPGRAMAGFQSTQKRGGGVRTTSDERDTLFARQPAYLTLAYVNDLTLDNVRIDITPEVYAREPRAAVSLHHTRNICLHRVRRIPDTSEELMPAVRGDC